MASLANQTISSTYDGLIKTSTNQETRTYSQL